MKRIAALFAVCLLAFGLTACSGSSTSAANYTTQQLVDAVTDSRTQDMNDAYPVFTLENGTINATGSTAGELTGDQIKTQGQLSLDMLGLSQEDVTQAAFSVSLMNVQSYGVGVFLPSEGRTEAVKTALEGFVQAQQAAQQNYLADQYAIAKAAQIKTLKNGAVVLVMCQDQNTVLESMEQALEQ